LGFATFGDSCGPPPLVGPAFGRRSALRCGEFLENGGSGNDRVVGLSDGFDFFGGLLLPGGLFVEKRGGAFESALLLYVGAVGGSMELSSSFGTSNGDLAGDESRGSSMGSAFFGFCGKIGSSVFNGGNPLDGPLPLPLFGELPLDSEELFRSFLCIGGFTRPSCLAALSPIGRTSVGLCRGVTSGSPIDIDAVLRMSSSVGGSSIKALPNGCTGTGGGPFPSLRQLKLFL
jgi:hypothetical protein